MSEHLGGRPELGGDLRLRGLQGPVVVLRDGLGIPHARAQSMHDAFFAQGFVHAQDRLWQMEYDRRRAAGRLAECVGSRALRLDVFARRMGLTASARTDHDAFDDETRGVIESYTAGVNACIESLRTLPVEFTLLGIEPEPWQPWHCGAVLKIRHVLMGTYENKLWRRSLMQALGPAGAMVPGSPHRRDDTLVVPVGARERWAARSEEIEGAALAAAAMADGSNNWVVHGSRTASGRPLMAGDPHRTLEVPNVYHQNHIACPDFDAIGLSMPGVPGMFHFGHNGTIAWCVTHAMADTQDLYVERFVDGTYEFRGEWRKAEHRTEVVGVRDSASVTIDVTATHHGPVLFGDPATGHAITMHWTSTDAPNTNLRAVLPMLRARSVEELDDVMRDWVDPCNNFLMADVHGTIGYLHRGRIPLRSRDNAWAPVPGWTGDHEWNGSVPFEELPRLRNPQSGCIVTANNRVVDMTYPHYLGMDYSSPNRARRILERLAALKKATAEDMAAVHADRVSVSAPLFVEAVEKLGSLPERLARARDVLLGWDRVMNPQSAGAALYAALRDRMAAVLVEREPLGRVVYPFEEDPYPTPAHTRVRNALPRLLETDDRSLLDGGDWKDLLTEALDRAVAYLEQAVGDADAWRWDAVHTTKIVHPLSRLFPEATPPLDPPVMSCGGDGECVQASSAEIGLSVVHSSVARYVFDLGDWDRSGWVVPGGASGHPASPHYSDQAAAWARVELYPMTYTWEKIEAGAESRQTLAPAR